MLVQALSQVLQGYIPTLKPTFNILYLSIRIVGLAVGANDNSASEQLVDTDPESLVTLRAGKVNCNIL